MFIFLFDKHQHFKQIEKEGHPLVSGLNTFDGGNTSFHVAGAVNESGANTVARWADGLPLLVVLDEHAKVERGRVVSLNFIPCSSLSGKPEDSEFWGRFLCLFYAVKLKSCIFSENLTH